MLQQHTGEEDGGGKESHAGQNTKKPSFLEVVANPSPTRDTKGHGLYFHHFIMYEFMLCSAGKSQGEIGGRKTRGKWSERE